MADAEFVEGLYFNEPHANAPDFVKGSLGVQKGRFIAWLQAQPEDTVKIDLKISRAGKPYAEKNTFKPSSDGARNESRPAQRPAQQVPAREASFGDGPEPSFQDDEIPFAPRARRELW